MLSPSGYHLQIGTSLPGPRKGAAPHVLGAAGGETPQPRFFQEPGVHIKKFLCKPAAVSVKHRQRQPAETESCPSLKELIPKRFPESSQEPGFHSTCGLSQTDRVRASLHHRQGETFGMDAPVGTSTPASRPSPGNDFAWKVQETESTPSSSCYLQVVWPRSRSAPPTSEPQGLYPCKPLYSCLIYISW